VNTRTSTTMFNRSRANTVSNQMYTFALQHNNSFGTIGSTHTYNSEYYGISQELNRLRDEAQDRLNQIPAGDTSMRNVGVRLAWRYEQAEIGMGEKGTTDWSKGQRQEILETGRTRDAEGHHINSVKGHPSDQANPDNIHFAKNREEHLAMHEGDFRNQTEGPLIDRDQRLEHANRSRIIKNELAGVGLAAAIGLGASFTLGFICTLAQNGFTAAGLRKAFVCGTSSGVEGASLAVINHVFIRGIGETATDVLTQFATTQLGLNLTENLIKMCSMTVVGIIAIGVSLTYQFIKLNRMGWGTKQVLFSAGKSASYSLSVLFISIVAQGIWGGHAGLIVSVSIGCMAVLWKLIRTEIFKQLFERIQCYMIEKLKPYYA